jgi:hypothetical protein
MAVTTAERLRCLSNEINKQINRINNDENTDLLEIIHMYYDENDDETDDNTDNDTDENDNTDDEIVD